MRLVLSILVSLLVSLPWVIRPEDVPTRWQPWSPLDLSGPPTMLTTWKLGRLSGDERTCLARLAVAGARVSDLPDRPIAEGCGILGRVRVTGLSGARLSPLVTRCEMAARLYLWERHVLQPAAQRHFGADVAEILHYDSYSCRRIRTSSGIGSRMSQHATANAVDISGFVLSDGRRITLLGDWAGTGPKAAFLREAHGGLCDWFNMVLSPDYNRLHADHFHADLGFWRGCR